MLNLRWPRVFLLLLGLATFASLPAAESKLRVLLITGGHDFDRDPYLKIYADNPEITLTHLEHTKGTADAWDRADVKACDVVVLYDMPPTITDAQQARFREIFALGKGLVVTHHALCSYQRWPDYERIIGGRWFDTVAKGGDPKEKPSGYRHDVDIPVQVVAPDHPVTAGVKDFLIHDEIYWDFRVSADVTPLLKTSHPDSGNPLAWTRTEGKSRVVYLLLGHGPSAYNDVNYRRLLANAIRWTANRDAPDVKPSMTKESTYDSTAAKASPTTAAGPGNYADVHGLKMYYELHGQGAALVILHGGLCAIPVWPAPIAYFSPKYRLIVPEQIGHGRTADDPKREMNYHDMAEDTAELLRQLKVESAYVIGWSDGGVVGLDLAIHHPTLVKKLVVSGANIRPSMTAQRGPHDRTADDIPKFVRGPYERLSPDGAGHWPVVYGRLDKMWRSQPNFTPAQLGEIKAATLVVAGDHDAPPTDQTVELFKAIPHAQLWIAPNADHGLPLNQAALFNATVEKFLTAK